LIELLVVIIIIGILAAIAIPIFLHQRGKAQDGSATQDLRSLAEQEELYLNEQQTYGTIASLRAAGADIRASPGVTVTVVLFDGNRSFCLSAKHQSTGTTFYWDSISGGQQPVGSAGCPVTTTGTAGDSITG
jgi:type II secretory pathway pseudopilin PulG